MSRKIHSFSVLFAMGLIAIAASLSVAQVDRSQQFEASRAQRGPGIPTLACCKCLGGSNTLDLSTITSNNWTVNGSPVAFLTTIHPLWNINPGPARWVSTVPTGGGSVAAGTFDYKLNFAVPSCAIEQRVTLTGNYGGDDDVYVYLDSISSASLIAQCTGGWCFNTPHKTLATFPNPGVGPSTAHTLIVRVVNTGAGASPSGMFVNAKLISACRN